MISSPGPQDEGVPAIKLGRPRSERARGAIFTAALDLALRLGYPNVTLLAVAAAAGVGRQTIYRWWPSKIALYLDVLNDELATRLTRYSEAGQRTLLAYLRVTYAVLGDDFGAMCVDILMDVSHGPGLRDSSSSQSIYGKAITRRREYVRSLLIELAQSHGKEFAVPLDVVLDMTLGLMWYRLIHRNLALDEPAAVAVHDAVLGLLR